jgi:tRNA (Thr-GGU) A37 N-methylase
MVPLYAARIQDLGPGDFVKVECIACRHEELLPADRLRIKGLPLPSYTPVLDLEPRLRCRECDARGKAVVSIKWGGA